MMSQSGVRGETHLYRYRCMRNLARRLAKEVSLSRTYRQVDLVLVDLMVNGAVNERKKNLF